MGRQSTGVWTTEESTKIKLSYLLKKKYVQKGCITIGKLSWTSGKSINIYADMHSPHKCIRLTYSITDSRGNKKEYDYSINIIEQPSNLGKGTVLYFQCPVSGKKCRILYQAYGCPIWKSREAYTNRIYYSSQTVSKLDRYNCRYWQLEEQIKALRGQRRSYTYMGKPTRRAVRLEGMKEQQEYMDEMRWSFAAMPVKLRNHIRSVLDKY